MSNKLVTILVGVLFVLVLALGGGMFMIWSKLSTVSAAARQDRGRQGRGKAQTRADGQSRLARHLRRQPGRSRRQPLPAHHHGPGGGRRKKSDDKKAEEEVTRRVPQMRDTILMILPTKRYADISTTEGKTALREELTGALNGLLPGAKIARIYFKEFVIQ